MKILLFVTAVVLCAAQASAWGVDGHYMVGYIAQSLLTTTAARKVKAVLPTDSKGLLCNVANWADQVKVLPEWAWTRELHYINVPDSSCTFRYATDCVKDICVAGAINNFTNIIRIGQDYRNPQNVSVQEALEFIVHFIGDIHQPLHVGHTSDEGGNTIKVSFFGTDTDLHAVWDTSIIQKRMDENFNSDHDTYADYLIKRINSDWAAQIPTWEECTTSPNTVCPDPWAVESIKLACSNAYKGVKSGDALTNTYYTTNWPIVEIRLAQAGVRLATAINRLF